MRFLLLTSLLASGCLYAQSFEAASVKLNKSLNYNGNSNTRPDNVEIKNMPLREIILEAFEIKDYQLVGPEWLHSERFDIVAKAPLGTGDDAKLMPFMRNLLTERFKLKFHRETKELPCYGLVPTKGGFKLKPAEPGPGGFNSNSGERGGEMKADKIDLGTFADWLSRVMDRPVLDMTGIKGAYTFELKYSKESARGMTDTPTHPVVSLAIQDQLGLRLEKRTAPVQMMIIDSAEKVPIEN